MHNKARDEALRKEALVRLAVLDTAPEREFDSIVQLAQRIFGCKTSYLSLIDADRQWFKARRGFEAAQVPRECSICASAVEANQVIVIADLQKHPVYGPMPEIKAAPHLRFFATVPLLGPDIGGERVPIGTLCVMDDKPRTATPGEIDDLETLAHLAELLLNARLTVRLRQQHAPAGEAAPAEGRLPSLRLQTDRAA